MRPSLALLALLGACTSSSASLSGRWLPDEAVASGEVVLGLTSGNGAIHRLAPGEEPALVDVGPRVVRRLAAAGDGTTVLGRAERRRCDDLRPRRQSPCKGEFETSDDLLVLRDGDFVGAFELGFAYGDPITSEDGRWAAAVVNPDAAAGQEGIVNLGSVLMVDLDVAEPWPVTVGFNASQVAFSPATDQAVVLSPGEVALVDLATRAPVPEVTFPLGLPSATRAQPAGVTITDDGTTALVATQAGSDLYVLDLVNPRVNLVALRAPPQRTLPLTGSGQTLVVYGQLGWIDLVDDLTQNVTGLVAPGGADAAVWRDGVAIAWRSGLADHVFRVDPDRGELTDYVLSATAAAVDVSQEGGWAAAWTPSTSSFSGSRRLDLLRLYPDSQSRLDADPVAFALPGIPVDLAFQGEPTDAVIFLMSDRAELASISLPSFEVSSLELPTPASQLTRLPDGTVAAIHGDSTGRVTFIRPDGSVETQAGFALKGLFDPAPFEETP
jgi:hypothetical protein